VRQHYEEMRQSGGAVVGVVLARPEAVAAFLAEQPLPFPLLADPTRAAYQAFELGRTSWATFLSLGVVLRYLGLIFRGWHPRRASRGEDLLQLGGDFVLDAEGRLVYAHRSEEPTDRPKIEALVAALR
jgi:peroxiredoxin